MEFTAVGKWDPSFNPAWDRNGDAIIDEGLTGLPDYVDLKVFNAPWKTYVAAYWTESWRQQLARKIDAVAAEHFDGVLLDVKTGYRTWSEAYPSLDLKRLREDSADVFRWVSAYAKRTRSCDHRVSGWAAPPGATSPCCSRLCIRLRRGRVHAVASRVTHLVDTGR